MLQHSSHRPTDRVYSKARESIWHVHKTELHGTQLIFPAISHILEAAPFQIISQWSANDQRSEKIHYDITVTESQKGRGWKGSLKSLRVKRPFSIRATCNQFPSTMLSNISTDVHSAITIATCQPHSEKVSPHVEIHPPVFQFFSYCPWFCGWVPLKSPALSPLDPLNISYLIVLFSRLNSSKCLSLFS